MTHFFCRWLAHAWGVPCRPEVVCHEARPPWAIDESQFLTLCTRCGDCFKACPNGLIKPADRPEYDGSPIAGTPVLDPPVASAAIAAAAPEPAPRAHWISASAVRCRPGSG